MNEELIAVLRDISRELHIISENIDGVVWFDNHDRHCLAVNIRQ